ncbi:MAG: hypothetical protein AB1531_10090 [Chloroflexota bacterium]
MKKTIAQLMLNTSAPDEGGGAPGPKQLMLDVSAPDEGGGAPGPK